MTVTADNTHYLEQAQDLPEWLDVIPTFLSFWDAKVTVSKYASIIGGTVATQHQNGVNDLRNALESATTAPLPVPQSGILDELDRIVSLAQRINWTNSPWTYTLLKPEVTEIFWLINEFWREIMTRRDDQNFIECLRGKNGMNFIALMNNFWRYLAVTENEDHAYLFFRWSIDLARYLRARQFCFDAYVNILTCLPKRFHPRNTDQHIDALEEFAHDANTWFYSKEPEFIQTDDWSKAFQRKDAAERRMKWLRNIHSIEILRLLSFFRVDSEFDIFSEDFSRNVEAFEDVKATFTSSFRSPDSPSNWLILADGRVLPVNIGWTFDIHMAESLASIELQIAKAIQLAKGRNNLPALLSKYVSHSFWTNYQSEDISTRTIIFSKPFVQVFSERYFMQALAHAVSFSADGDSVREFNIFKEEVIYMIVQAIAWYPDASVWDSNAAVWNTLYDYFTLHKTDPAVLLFLGNVLPWIRSAAEYFRTYLVKNARRIVSDAITKIVGARWWTITVHGIPLIISWRIQSWSYQRIRMDEDYWLEINISWPEKLNKIVSNCLVQPALTRWILNLMAEEHKALLNKAIKHSKSIAKTIDIACQWANRLLAHLDFPWSEKLRKTILAISTNVWALSRWEPPVRGDIDE